MLVMLFVSFSYCFKECCGSLNVFEDAVFPPMFRSAV